MASNKQGEHPGYQQDREVVVPSHAAATATEAATIYAAERACRLKKVDIFSRDDVTGADGDSTTLDVLVNGASKASLALVATPATNLAKNVKKALYAPATPLSLAAGDVVTLQFTKVGNGLLVPDLFVRSVIDFENVV